MTIHLSKELERFVHDAVRAGLYAREDDVVNDAVARLRQAMPEGITMPDQRATHPTPTEQQKPLTKEEFQQRLIEIGLMSSLPTPADPMMPRPTFQPVTIEGETLSETIIRERR
jgi:Arc/MetJ-type ribon-helix-helix transcriptional regulator